MPQTDALTRAAATLALGKQLHWPPRVGHHRGKVREPVARGGCYVNKKENP